MRWKFPPFTTYWVSVVTVAVYVPILAALICVHETLPCPSASNPEISIDAAWSDLETISRLPHPYNSHENEAVRRYLLQRVQALAEKYPTVKVADDLTSNATWIYDGHTAFYIEGSNILVKVDGKNESLPAVLFSAHIDSSATAQGATDDGMGTVTLLSLIEQFARDPPRRTTVFNLNNGEEEALCGSHLFFEHPWSSLPDIFLNLEGAGSGGRLILFRGSTVQLVETFKKTARPHGTVTSSDAYALGLIKSQTDFEVYVETGGMKGLDATFYVNRDKYHTMADTVANLNGRASLWSELQLVRDVGRALANLDTKDDSEKAVYWDIFGSRMIVFGLSELSWRLPRLMLSNTLVIAVMMAYLWSNGRALKWTSAWAYLPTSMLSGIIASIVLTALYCKINPMIIYSSSYPVLLSMFTAVALSLLFPLRYLGVINRYPPHAQRSLVSGQYFVITSLLLLGFLHMVEKLGFTGFYFIEWIYGGAAFALIVDAGVRVWNTAGLKAVDNAAGGDIEAVQPLLEPSLHSQLQGPIDPKRPKNLELYKASDNTVWLLTYIVNVFPTLILVCPLALVVCAGLGQTLADGSSPVIVYAGLNVLLFLSILPLVPFAHQLSTRIFAVLAVIFALTTIYSLGSFPFSPNKQVKIFYTQNLDLDTGRNTVRLLGVQPYLRQALLSVPSAKNANQSVIWSTHSIRDLGHAEWEGLAPANFISIDSGHLVTSTARRLDEYSAVFTVKGQNTKSCVIEFDQNIMDVQVRRAEPESKSSQSHGKPTVYTSKIPKNTAYSIPSGGVPVVSLYSRDWDTEFEVIVRWNSTAHHVGKRSFWRSILPIRSVTWPARTGRIGCQWHEFHARQLPAVDELLDFLPEWATITVKEPLLVADRAFSV